jgi:hypothetical protein
VLVINGRNARAIALAAASPRSRGASNVGRGACNVGRAARRRRGQFGVCFVLERAYLTRSAFS